MHLATFHTPGRPVPKNRHLFHIQLRHSYNNDYPAFRVTHNVVYRKMSWHHSQHLPNGHVLDQNLLTAHARIRPLKYFLALNLDTQFDVYVNAISRIQFLLNTAISFVP